ncbi:hypothetical protein H2203_008274 [Taxawa tesnikishii (nom. ined.)]|nr:hypothetical protein H2203_008274 [Dothideales sp. JES 119]
MPGCNAVSYYPYPLEGLYENVCIYKSGYAAKASVNRFYDSAVLPHVFDPAFLCRQPWVVSNLNVLIVGASIAGPTAAYWFSKAGANVTIIERFPALRTNGQGIDIRTAGVTVMRKIPGMEAAVRVQTTTMEGISFVQDDGEPFATMRASGNESAQSLVSEYEIFRGDLAQILFDLTKDDSRIRYVFGEQVASMQQNDEGPVTVEFANGYATQQFDLVVACDGATSRTRAIAYFSIAGDLLEGSKLGQSYSATGATPKNRVTLMKIHARNAHDSTAEFRLAAKQGTDALRNFVAKEFAGAGWKTEQIMAGMMETDDLYASEIVQVKVPSLSRGRVVLVGDAGYATGPTGSGTSAAMAGAYILAGEINNHAHDLKAGLGAYEERMRPIITDMQKIPPGVPGIFAPQTRWGITLRNVLFRLVAWGMELGSYFSWLGGLFASSFGGDKYGLPDYEWMSDKDGSHA